MPKRLFLCCLSCALPLPVPRSRERMDPSQNLQLRGVGPEPGHGKRYMRVAVGYSTYEPSQQASVAVGDPV